MSGLYTGTDATSYFGTSSLASEPSSVRRNPITLYNGISYHAIINVTYTPIVYVEPLGVRYDWSTDTHAYADAKSEVRKVTSGYIEGRHNAYVRDWKTSKPSQYYGQMRVLNNMENSGLRGIIVENKKEVDKLRTQVLQECYTNNTEDVSSLKLNNVPLHTLYTHAFTDTYKSGDLVCLRRFGVGNNGLRDYSIFPNLREIIYYFTYSLRLQTIPSAVSHMTIMRSSGLNNPEDNELKDLAKLNIHYLRIDCAEYTGEWLRYIPSSVYMLVINFKLIKRTESQFDPRHLSTMPFGNLQVIVIGMRSDAHIRQSAKDMETQIHKFNPQVKVYFTVFGGGGDTDKIRDIPSGLQHIIKNAWFG